MELGVLYSVIKTGEGPIPTEDDEVEIKYTGRLEDGTIFASMTENDTAIKLSVNQVVGGLKIALMHMTVGSKWTIFLPFETAYGEQGTDEIPPYSNLILEVELVSKK